MMPYRTIKRTVLVILLGSVCFLFGYLYFGRNVSAVISGPTASEGGGPPAPVMQQIRMLKEAIAANPNDGKSYCDLANLYFQANKFDQATNLYEKAVQINGNDIVARNDLALCYHIAKREKDALNQLETALRISPGSQHLWLTLGLIRYETGKTNEARKALSKAESLDPKSEAGTEARSMLASLAQSRPK